MIVDFSLILIISNLQIFEVKEISSYLWDGVPVVDGYSEAHHMCVPSTDRLMNVQENNLWVVKFDALLRQTIRCY